MEKLRKTQFKELNKQLNNFYHQLKENYEEEELVKIFAPLNKKSVVKRDLLLILTIILFCIFYKTSYETFEWYFLALSRILLVKILPLYDWTKLNQECLIPLNNKPEFKINCDQCENIKSIDVFENISEEAIIENYLDIQKPVILKNPNQWNFDKILDDMFDNIDYSDSHPCEFSSNLISQPITLGKFLKRTKLDSYFVHFQNCELDAMKFFRTLTPQNLLPNTCSPVQYNWLLWSKNYAFPNFKKIALIASENWKIVAQIRGSFAYKLTNACESACRNLTIELAENEVLIFTNFWFLEYASFEDSAENAAAILETHSLYPD